ncbi:MAG: M15 family metallopeptidase [Firmicutes bacterium]|nr:M15 family metallopeptidase [Bacillota bacterium]
MNRIKETLSERKDTKMKVMRGILLIAITVANVYTFVSTSQLYNSYKQAVDTQIDTTSDVPALPPIADVDPNSPQSDWQLRLVKQYQALPHDYKPKLATVAGTQVDERIVSELAEMLQAAESEGVTLWLSSGYRSIEKQKELYERKVNEYKSKGLSSLEAEACAATIVARPGMSEHNLGLAIDFNGVTNSFKETKEYEWLLKNGADYGFILRYPEGKYEITGVIFEPWHFRYVGSYHAKNIMEMNVVLEEYVVILRSATSTL